MTFVTALIHLAAGLPDMGQPTFPATCGTFGGFVGAAIGIGRRLPHDRTTRLATYGGAVGYGVGFAAWVVAVAMDRL